MDAGNFVNDVKIILIKKENHIFEINSQTHAHHYGPFGHIYPIILFVTLFYIAKMQ